MDAMKTIYAHHKDRFHAAMERIRDAYLHKPVKRPAVVISDVNVAITGETPSLIPDDYFTSPQVMSEYQLARIERHIETFDDDYVPLLFPWFGTGVVPSAMGCEIHFQPKLDPAVGAAVLTCPEDVGRLSLPDPYKDGLMPCVLACIDYMRACSDLPVSFTDAQGPLNIALCLCGLEALCYWMYDAPEAVHRLMDFCTEALIAWIKVQKQHAGQKLDGGAFPHCIALPEGFGGVWISDDDCTLLSAELYREFVVPYNSRVFEAFGGGTLHFCSTAEHQIENFQQTRGLTGINNFCMGNFRQIRLMQQAFGERLAIMVCDFSPLDMEAYYRDLIGQIDFKGVVLASFIAPEFAMVGGKYVTISRDRYDVAGQAWQAIDDACRARQSAKGEC